MEVFSGDDLWTFFLWLHICHFAIDRKLDFRKSVSHVSPKNTEFLTRADSNYLVELKAVPLFLTKTRVTLLKSRPLLRVWCKIPNEVTCHCALQIMKWSGNALCRNVSLLYFVFNCCAAKTKYRVTPEDQHAGQYRHKMKCSKSFERVEQFKYLWTTLTNLNVMHEDSESRADWNQEMLAIIMNKIVCLPVRYPKI
jgi:hypothetical protein